jgi:hypothetical protein
MLPATIMTAAKSADFPVLIDFKVVQDTFLLLTKATVLESRVNRTWCTFDLEKLRMEIWTTLENHVFLGPIEAPEDADTALAEFAAEGWYIPGSNICHAWALQMFRARYRNICFVSDRLIN